MKNKKITLILTLFTLQIGISQINTPSGIIQGNSGASTNVGIGTGSGVLPNAKLEILSSTNQVRLSNTSTIFTDVNTSNAGNFSIFPKNNTTTGKIGFGIPTTNIAVPLAGFHSNLGTFRVSDNANTTRAVQINPTFTGSGDVPSGSSITSIISTVNEGLSLYSNGSGAPGVKLGGYAYSVTGWKSMWETANVNLPGQLPNLLLVKNGGNVGIGMGATAPTAKLEVAGQVKITGGTPGAGKVLTSDANGLASWVAPTGVLAGGTTNYIPKWTSANALSSTSLIYDDNTNVGIATNTPYKKLNVNGDVAFLGVNGNNALEIIGNGTIPSRRGISLDNDPSGKFNFYIHAWQTNASFNFKNGVGDANLMSILANGNVGIGNANPSSHLDMVSANLGTAGGSQVAWAKFSGDVGSGNNDQLKIYSQRASAGGSNWNTSEIKIQRTVDASNMNFISFRSTNATYGLGAIVFGNDNTDHMSISSDGHVSIGPRKLLSGPHTDAYLTVDGKIVSTSCYVTQLNWADFVFETDYKLPSLTEIENYYLINKHLPNIPSAKEVAENGIDIGEMNKLLLQKIEELTILMVQQEKRIKGLENKK